jgi:hypothetical protein
LLRGFTEHRNERKVPVMRLRLRVSLRLLKSSNTLLIVNAKTGVFQHHDRSRLMKVSIRQPGTADEPVARCSRLI